MALFRSLVLSLSALLGLLSSSALRFPSASSPSSGRRWILSVRYEAVHVYMKLRPAHLSAVDLVPMTFLLSSLNAQFRVWRPDLLGSFPDHAVKLNVGDTVRSGFGSRRRRGAELQVARTLALCSEHAAVVSMAPTLHLELQRCQEVIFAVCQRIRPAPM